jgi:DHA1 family tetracycline resistance protein-like MFS transporter
VLLLARLIGGVTGASFSVANAYLADISSPEDRARNFGLVGAAFGFGFICGPMLGGLLGEIDLHLPFYAAAGLAFANALYGYLVVPESLSREHRSAFSLKKANPFSALMNLVRHQAMGSLVVVFALFSLGHMTMIQTWVLFTHFRFDWGPRENGILLFCVGVLSVVVQGGLIGRLVKLFGEERLALTAIGVNIFIQIAYGLAPVGWMMFPILFLGFLNFTAGPAVQGVVSKNTPRDMQGITLGSMHSINSLALVLGPLIGNGILAQVAELPPNDFRVGASFFFCAALNLIAFLLLRWRLSKPASVPAP